MKPRRHQDPELLAAIREIKCAACLAPPPSEAHHLRSRGAGGGDHPWNVVPLCAADHREWHQFGPAKFFRHHPDFLGVLGYMGWDWDGKRLTHPLAGAA